MIKVHLQSLGPGKPLQGVVLEGQSLMEASRKLLRGTPYEVDPSVPFGAMLNGLKVEKSWDEVILSKGDVIILAPTLRGDNTALRVAAIIAISVASGGLGTTLFAAGTWQAMAVTAASTMLGTMAFNSAFPPPNSKGLGDEKEVEDSQMYVISSQSNKVNKNGSVPRVYGTHRVFPTVAANPYTTFEADVNGKLINYLYAIYDFGYGPLNISDIRIGETSIGDFADVDVRFVDPNKPSVDEGIWDQKLEKEFKYYKGDVTTENVGVTFEKNQTDTPTPPEGDWRAVRTSAPNSPGAPTELSVLLVAPRGLIAYNNAGLESERSVFFNIEFAPAGTEDWVPFNDMNYVRDYRTTGGGLTYSDFPLTVQNTDLFFLENITKLSMGYSSTTNSYKVDFKYAYGFPKGTTYIELPHDNYLQPGSTIRCGGEFLGIVSTVDYVAPGRSRYNLVEPTSRAFPVMTKVETRSISTVTGNITHTETKWQMSYKLVRGIPNLSKVVLKAKDTEALYATYKFWPRQPGQYKVRVTRVQSTSQYSKTIVDQVVWSTLETRFDAVPIKTQTRHVFMELRIKATNQLSGSISNLSALAQSVLDVYDGTTWSKQPTNNPAWVYVDMLTGSMNKRAVSKSKLHLDSIMEWAEYCDEIPPSYDITKLRWVMPRFECNFVMDFNNTLQQIVDRVTAAGHASMSIIDGKYGVLIDKRKTVPVQIFTPRNSSNFQSSRSYPVYPDGLAAQHVDPNVNWEMGSKTVYAPGKDETNSTNIEELATFACTNWEQAWREAAYYMAQGKLRQENISIDVDYEGLICVKGDFVQYVQDVMRVGGKASRVVSVLFDEVSVDDSYDNISGTWGYIFRNIDGQIFKGVAVPTSADTFTLEGPEFPAPGDLIVFGETDKVAIDLIVKAINPKDDFSATLTLIEKADAIHDVETGVGIPDYDPQLSKVTNSDFTPPAIVEEFLLADSGYECANGDYQFYALLDWEPPTGSAWELFEVYANFGNGYALVAQTRESFYKYLVSPSNIGKEHTFKVLAVSASGLKLNLIAVPEVSYLPVKKTTPPSDVESFASDVTGEVLELNWTRVPDCDISFYQVRYSPLADGGAWGASIPLNRAAANQGSMSVQARTGTYFIKAVDYNGNESETPAVIITTIPNLFGLNLLHTISDTPNFLGVKDRVEKLGSAIVLRKEVTGDLNTQSYYSEGYYYYRDLIDLGDIYTARIEANVQASGYSENDLIINWVPIASANPLVKMRPSDWDVEVQYRVSDKRNVMADWDLLMNIDPISEGVQANFSEWRKFTQGDITGRVIQFRLKLISYKPTVTPRVFDGTIKASMPNRTRRFDNIIAPEDGITLNYDPPFKGPGTTPNIQITIDNAQSGDRWEFVERTLEKFTIRFFDAADNPVERQFDAQVVGYGYKNTSII